jgi:ATP-binding cassette subfamily B protein
MIKTLIKSVREYKKASILAPVFVTLEVIMEVAIPFLMANLIDLGIDKGDMGYVFELGAALVVLALISLTFGALSGGYAASAAAGFAANLRRDMYYKVQDFSFSNIDKFSSASIVTRLTTDVTNVQMAYMLVIRVAVRCPVMLLFSIIMSFNINSTISLIFLGVVPLLALGFYIIVRKVHPIFEWVFKLYDKLNNVVQENLRGIRVVKSFVSEAHEVKKFGETSKALYKKFLYGEKMLVLAFPMMQTAVYVCMLLAAWIGARLIVGGNMTTGELMSIIAYAMMILLSLMMLAMVFAMIIISRASAERIHELLVEKSDIVNPPEPVYEVKNGDIRFENVSFSYAGDPARLCMFDVNIDIRSGETIGIIGGTGSSKSTLVQLIPRLYDATKGRVLVGDVDVRDYDLKTLRDSVAMVLQKNELFSGTIKENLRWGNENATDEELVHACRLAQADSFIDGFEKGYDTYIEQGGINVSGGQKQRLCIARALLKKPKILILDDSTSAVDTNTDARIRRAFKEEIPNTTKLIIAQRIASVQDADKIIVMESGRVDAIGTHEELLKSNTIYREVYLSQQKGGISDDAQ